MAGSRCASSSSILTVSAGSNGNAGHLVRMLFGISAVWRRATALQRVRMTTTARLSHHLNAALLALRDSAWCRSGSADLYRRSKARRLIPEIEFAGRLRLHRRGLVPTEVHHPVLWACFGRRSWIGSAPKTITAASELRYCASSRALERCYRPQSRRAEYHPDHFDRYAGVDGRCRKIASSAQTDSPCSSDGPPRSARARALAALEGHCAA